jgi:UDP-glucuronate decarboxylase
MPKDRKTILITGGAGFIGTNLCRLLVDKHNIFIYDNISRGRQAITNILHHKNVHVFEGDMLDFRSLQQLVSEIEPNIVIHLAAVVGVNKVIEHPVATMKVNIIGTFNILEAIKPFIAKIDRFINFSTSEVFGAYAYKVEEHQSTNLAPVGEARWTYSASKLAAEHLIHSFHKEFGLRAVTVRPFNIYGPGRMGEHAIITFISRAVANEDIKIHGDGDQIRSWCYIDDMIQGTMLCLEKKQAVGNTFNIGNPRGTITINSLAEKILQLSGSKSKMIHIPKNYVDIDLRIPSIDKAQMLLGYNPKVDLDEGLKRTIAWYKSTL